MPLLIALLAPLLWGSTYAVVSLYLTDYSPYWVAVWRALPAGILLLLLHPRRPPLTWNRQFLLAFCNIRDSAANLGINCFIQNTKKLKQPSLMLLNTRYEALAAKFECVDTFEF